MIYDIDARGRIPAKNQEYIGFDITKKDLIIPGGPWSQDTAGL